MIWPPRTSIERSSRLDRRKRLILAAAGVLALFLIAAGLFLLRNAKPTATIESRPQVSMTARNPRNVVLIVLDALRADRVYAERNGVPLMPYLAKFGERCVRFTHANAACTWTRPSISSILTSLYIDTHQVWYGFDPNRPKEATANVLSASYENMASYLRRADYYTAVIQNNGNLVRDFGFAEGFDSYEYMKNDVPAQVITPAAITRISMLREPFFFYVHYMDPHLPYTPPQKYRDMLGWPPAISDEELAVVNNIDGKFMDYLYDHCDYMVGNKPKPSMTPLSDAAKEAARTLYDGEARSLDDELGKFIDTILAEKPNSTIIVLADHGEHLWDHGFMGHGLTMYEEELHVPFFLYAPGLPTGSVEREVCTIDVLPTVAELLGLPASAAWQGSSLFAPGRESSPVFSHTYGAYPSLNTEREAVKLGPLKLIVDRKKERYELYDLAADPHEKTNLAAERPDVVATFSKFLDEHKARNLQARGGVKRQTVDVSREIREGLQKIGYGNATPEDHASPAP